MKSDRLIALLALLQSAKRRTARELAAELEVSERTIYRDVDALALAGVPVYTERGIEGGISLAEGYRRALTHFTSDEVAALFATGASFLGDLGLGKGMERALDKLRGGFSDMQRRAAEHAKARVYIDQRRWERGDPPVERLALLRRAVWDDRRVELHYEDQGGKETRRSVDPLGLVSKAGRWYLVARTDDGYRTFRVDRVRDARELTERFERPSDFELDAHWQSTTARYLDGPADAHTIVVRVAPQAMERVCSYWPYETVDASDPCVLRIRITTQETALHHLIAWGTDVVLLEPSDLRQLVIERARALLAHYQ